MEKLHQSEIHPDSWPAAFIRDPADTEARLAAVAGDKYSYRELDDFTDLMGRTLQGAPEVAKIDRKGVLPEQIFLDYSQQRLAEYGMTPIKSERHSGRAQHHASRRPTRGRATEHSD